MKVKEARKEVQNIEKTLSIIAELPYKEMDGILEKVNSSMEWDNMSVHIINSMAAYKNILKDKIENAEI